MDHDTITAMKWAKPVHRRSPEQRTAHLILTFTSADAANRAITNGLHICNRRCYVERVKREPTRCLKCQGWNHFAKECQEENNKCGNCTKNHRTNDCPTPQERCCVSCKSDDHASWSRECPTFIKKLNDLNDRNPENALQYIPTADPWTWTTNTKPVPQSRPPPPIRPTIDRNRPQPTKKRQAPPRQYDSYVPNYDRYGNRTNTNDSNEWDNPAPPKDLNTFRPLTQQYLDSVNNENPNGPVNPTPTATS